MELKSKVIDIEKNNLPLQVKKERIKLRCRVEELETNIKNLNHFYQLCTSHLQVEINTCRKNACCKEKKNYNAHKLLKSKIEKSKHHIQYQKEIAEKMKSKEKKLEHRIKEIDKFQLKV